jgi:integrase/recombinase XerD
MDAADVYVVSSRDGRGGLVVRVGIPLADVYLEFLGGRCRPNTVLAAAYDLKVFFTVVARPLDQVRPADVLAFITAQRTGRGGDRALQPAGLADEPGGVSAATVRRRLSIVSGFFAFLQARGDVTANPVPRGLPTRRERSRPGQGVPLVRAARRLPRILSPAQVDALTAALRTHRDQAMVAAMVLGGLRRCEVLGLRLGDLRVAERRVFVAEGKGGRQRLIPVSGRFFAAVAAYLDAERPPGAGTDRVFVVLKGPRRGQPLSARGMEEILTTARRRAGLDHATCHELRHTCLTRLQRRGVASDATFRARREDTRPALQLPRPSQREGRVGQQSGNDLRCHHPVASTERMLHPLLLHPTTRMMRQMQQKSAATRKDATTDRSRGSGIRQGWLVNRSLPPGFRS